MKKTLIALAVLATAGSVNAAQIYGSDTSKVSMKGEIDGYLSSYEQDTTASNTNKYDPDVNVWAKIQVDAEHQLNDMFKAFGSFEIENGSDWKGTSSTAKFDDLYAGVKTDTWGVVFGEHGDWADSMDATEKDDITNEGYYLGNAGGHHTESTGHGVGFKFYGIDNLTVVADVTTEQTDGLDNTYGVSLDYTMGNFGVGASYQNGEVVDGVDYYKAGVSASATFGGLYLAATYVAYEGVDSFGFFQNDANADKDKAADAVIASSTYYEGNSYGVAAAYTIDNLRLYTTYALMSNDKAKTTTTTTDLNDADTYNWVLGTDYKVYDNFLVFLEYQTAEAEKDLVTGTDDLSAHSVVSGFYYTF